MLKLQQCSYCRVVGVHRALKLDPGNKVKYTGFEKNFSTVSLMLPDFSMQAHLGVRP